ncbi:C-C chemokine receptor type 5-like isoform X1 [Electrophorus electricus]|uniref:C-C chemokine receptor type 5-like isoform X1 n=2 Tax=Electrophorus electricus TaxID=8005 RepID=UPI0015CFFDC8|nr:C-C chemokine receptor type 5-like isoform X1 [Electrophorus electricus]
MTRQVKNPENIMLAFSTTRCSMAVYRAMENSTASLLITHSLIASTISAWNNITSAPKYTTEPDVSTEDIYYEYYNTDIDESFGICDYGSHDKHFLPVLYSLFFVVGFLGNALVVWVILGGAHLRSMTDVCLLNLAFADLLLVICLPFLAHYARDHWVFGSAICTVVLSSYYVGFYSGIFFIVLMSVDRYLAVVHAVYALRIRTKAFGILSSALVWVVAVMASFPELMYLRVQTFNNTQLCSAYQNKHNQHDLRVIGVFKMNALGLLLPLAVMGFCYWKVLRRLLKLRASKQQAVRLVVVVMAVFYCCWTPYNVVAFLKNLELKGIWETDCESSKRIQVSLQVTEAIAYSHSCLNPFLYVFMGEKFKRQLVKLLRKTPCIKLQFMKKYFPSVTGSVYSQTTTVEERSTGL